MRVLLFIGNVWREAVCNEATDPDINITWDNLSNPSQTTDDYTYNLTLPRCADNDRMFSNFAQLDSVVNGNGYDPTKAMPVLIVGSDGQQMMQGKATVDTITESEYQLSVVGMLSDVWRKLMNSGWDADNTDEGYTQLDDVVSTNLNRFLVSASFGVEPSIIPFELTDIVGQGDELARRYLIPDPAMAEAVSLIGFAPTAQGRPKDMDTKQWVTMYKVEDVLQQYPDIMPLLTSKRDAEGNDTEKKEVGDGLVEAQMSQYRSYLQKPYVYVSKLWQLYLDNCFDITGYNMVLDDRWFNEDNSLLRDVVYTLPCMYKGDSPSIAGTSEQNLWYSQGNGLNLGSNQGLSEVTLNNPLSSIQYNLYTVNRPADEYTEIECKLRINIEVGSAPVHAGYENVVYPRQDIPTMYAKVSVNGGVVKVFDLILVRDNYSGDVNVPNGVVMARCTGAPATGGTIEVEELSVNIPVLNNIATIRIECGFIETSVSPFIRYDSTRRNFVHCSTTKAIVSLETSSVTNKHYKCTRSNMAVTLGSLFGGVSPFSVLVKYAKMMRLCWIVDEVERVIYVKRVSDHLRECLSDVRDITRYCDSREAQIKPLSWATRNVLLNYADTDMVQYAEKYGQTYGSQKIVTANQLNDNTTELLGNSESDTIASPILTNEVVYRRVDVEQNNGIASSVTNETMIMNHVDGESADASGAFFIRQENGKWNRELMWRDMFPRNEVVCITDDTIVEHLQSTYCYHNLRYRSMIGNSEDLQQGTRPVFDICDSSQAVALQFAPTREVYSTNEYPDTMRYLYSELWERYIAEVYDPNNKTLIVSAYLPIDVVRGIKRNPIVRISGIYYMCCKVEGWRESTGKARLTLRQISEPRNLYE